MKGDFRNRHARQQSEALAKSKNECRNAYQARITFGFCLRTETEPVSVYGFKAMPRATSKNNTDSGNFSEFIQHVRLAGQSRGLVKNLRGFNKKHHSEPEFASTAAMAFLGKLCAEELSEEAEAFFQKTRAALGYKRKEISLDVTSPSAMLVARDFTLEWAYALDESAPSEWTFTQTLHALNFSHEKGKNTPMPDAFDVLFAGMFDSIVFSLTKGAQVEAVIDAVEALDTGEDPTNPASLTVTYPSDCSSCTLRVADVAAEVVFNGGELSMVFPRHGSPRELIETFVAVRQAFAFTKSSVLAGLL